MLGDRNSVSCLDDRNDDFSLNTETIEETTEQVKGSIEETEQIKLSVDEILSGIDKYNESDLIKAIKSNDFILVKEIVNYSININYGININILDENGNPIIFYANKELLDFLIEKGANIDIKGWNGWTLLMLAAFEGNSDKVEFLLANGAQKNVKDNFGITAFIYALMGANIKTEDNKLPKINKIIKLLSE